MGLGFLGWKWDGGGRRDGRGKTARRGRLVPPGAGREAQASQ